MARPKPLSALGPDLRKIGLDIQEPEEDAVHEELLEWQAGFTLAHEQRLGPSLKEPAHENHVFRVVGGRAELGSSLPYARAYQSYRVRHGLVSFFELDPISAERLLARITDDAFIKAGWNGRTNR